MPLLIGTAPNQIPTNGLLGKMAFQDPQAVKITGGDLGAVTQNGYELVNQGDVGVEPNQIPLNGMLGELASMDKDKFVLKPTASAVPQGIGELVFQLASDTSLVIKVKGSDGTVRSVALTLA